jgi:hypothetical protein
MTNAINNLLDGSYVDERFNVYINTLTDLKHYMTYYDNDEDTPDDTPDDIECIIGTIDYEYREGWIDAARAGMMVYPTTAQTYEKLFDFIITEKINEPIWDIQTGMNIEETNVNNWWIPAQMYKQQHGIYRDVGQNVSPYIETDDIIDISIDEDPCDEDPCN